MNEQNFFKNEKPSDFGRDEQGKILSPSEISEILFDDKYINVKGSEYVRLADMADNQMKSVLALGLEIGLYEKFIEIFENKSIDEQKLLVDGCVYANDLIGNSPVFCKYSDYFPEYGSALFSFMYKVKRFESNLGNLARETFGQVTSSQHLEKIITELYRKHISEVIKKQEVVLSDLLRRSELVHDRHNIYEENILGKAFVSMDIKEGGEIPPEAYQDAEKLVNNEGWVDMKAELKSILGKIDEQIELLSRRIDNIDLQTCIFLAAFRSLADSGVKIDIELIDQAELKLYEGSELSSADITFMRSVYSQNQKDSAVHDELLESFDKKVSDSKTQFSIFRWQNKIQSFLAFTDQGDSLYMSSFNVTPDVRGFKIGEAMLDQVVSEQAKNHILEADCDAKLPISAKYIETGWVGTSYFEDKNRKTNESDWIIYIKRNDNLNAGYWGKLASKESIITQRTHPENVKVEVAKTQAELPFQLCNEGYVLTRMFTDKSGLSYGVFELPIKEEANH